MTILYVIIGLLAVLAAKSILDVQRLARRYTHALRRKTIDPHPQQV